MSILRRFKMIMASNIHTLLAKADDPKKVVNQYLRELSRDFGQVKAEMATVDMDEQRAKRALDECKEERNKMERYAKKSLEYGNEADARKFLEKKASLASKEAELRATYDHAATNVKLMRQMYEKLASDIHELESRTTVLKGKASVAQTKKGLNRMQHGFDPSMSPIGRMEEAVNRAYDEAEAIAELNRDPFDDIKEKPAKYDKSIPVDNELALLKEQLQDKEKGN